MVKSSKEKIKHDELKVLAELETNSKSSIDSIAKRCGFSRQKVWRIIKQLEKNRMIWGYTAITDDDKKDLTHFILLIKRTVRPLERSILEKIDSLQLEDIALPQEVYIENSCFVHGDYDWIISFTSPDMNHAKKFCNTLLKSFPGAIAKIDLQQSIYFVRKQHIFNPNRKKLKDLM